MAGKRADSRRDEEIAAAYASGLSLRECAARFGIARETARAATARAGVPLRKPGRPGKPRPWAGLAAARHLAGERTGALAREYRVSPAAMRQEIERQGGTVTRDPRGRPPGGAA
jgi:hypothetical protein